ncbi:LOB domain-containing protein 20-like [Trifolium pratense]|uniref:LOB domain-containing protein 20-like n=1 Tax=Trifolium pratense TaxID=57577 RepID=UPI001E6932AC|nr:LOB domain-containing protein 20-like [Trifolium pratense]
MAESQGGDVSSATRHNKGANIAKLDTAGATQEVAVTMPCGVCKYLKKKCTSECISAPYYGKGAASFAAEHRVFGASNVSKLLSNISTNHRHKAAVTIYPMRLRLGYLIPFLVAAMQVEVSMMQSQLMNRRYAYSSALQTTHQKQHQIQQQPNFNVSVQPAYSNNICFHQQFHEQEQLHPGFDLTLETAPSSHSLEPFQNSRMLI